MDWKGKKSYVRELKGVSGSRCVWYNDLIAFTQSYHTRTSSDVYSNSSTICSQTCRPLRSDKWMHYGVQYELTPKNTSKEKSSVSHRQNRRWSNRHMDLEWFAQVFVNPLISTHATWKLHPFLSISPSRPSACSYFLSRKIDNVSSWLMWNKIYHLVNTGQFFFK